MRGYDVLQGIFIIRMLRLLFLISELEQFTVIAATFNKFSRPFFTMMLSLYTVFFFFAFIGDVCWNGLITVSAVAANEGTPTLYYLMNFNDFPNSLLTLFHIMVVNNWYVTCDMFCTLAGNIAPRLYFVAFWVVTVLIMLNIVISFVLEVYGAAEEEVQAQFKRRAYLLKVQARFKA